MFVCVCNAIREQDFRKAAHKCCGDVDAVYGFMGFTPQCGQCLDDAAHILIEERENASAEPVPG
ncbi:MAG: (2Fe-2S)-binding protein [Novosphingobium sp.]